MLSKEEIIRYNKHLLLSEIGLKGQELLKQSRVLVIGAGGLGCPLMLYLAAAGIGKMGIVDFDLIDETNLHRQILFEQSDVGKLKTEVAGAKLQKQNPFLTIELFDARLSAENAIKIFSEYDIIIDGTDNFATRYLVNDACFILKKPLISGSIFRFEGQVAVFDFRNENAPTYRCLFPVPPPPETAPSCTEAGVLGVLPGIIGTLMANETIKLIVGVGELLTGKVLIINSLTMNFQTLEFERNLEAISTIPKSEIEFKNFNYNHFCESNNPQLIINEVSVNDLWELIVSKENIQVLDVRKKGEQPEIEELIDLKIPLDEIGKHVSEISRDKKVIVYCNSGLRSAKAIDFLQSNYDFKNLFNLKGGVMAWIGETKNS